MFGLLPDGAADCCASAAVKVAVELSADAATRLARATKLEARHLFIVFAPETKLSNRDATVSLAVSGRLSESRKVIELCSIGYCPFGQYLPFGLLPVSWTPRLGVS